MTTADAVLREANPEEKLNWQLNKIKSLEKVELPRFDDWNYGPCEAHDTARPDCEFRACGGEFFSHQTVGVMWLYARKRALLADSPGLGKSNQILGLLCLLKQKGELNKRAMVVANTPAVPQWGKEAARFAPGLKMAVILPGMSKKKRIELYSGQWEVLIIGHHMLNKDFEWIERLRPGTLVSDDVDAILNHDTATHKKIVQLSKSASRVVVCNASQSQIRMQQIHASMAPVVGTRLWGGLASFEKRYEKREKSSHNYFVNGLRKTAYTSKVVGVQNGEELRGKLMPYVLKRSYENLTDISMPTLMPPTNVWLELYPRQRQKYKELQDGLVKLRKEDGTEFQKKAKALAAYTYASQVTAGMSALGEKDGKGQSVKLDWVFEKVMTVWSDQKVVVFAKNVGIIQALQHRLELAGIGYATIWGKNNKKGVREAEIKRFWEDPNCRVMMGTSAMERSLNLQVANILINIDSLTNPERMKQLVGRVRRAGSAHKHIYVFNLFAADTHEERTVEALSKRDAINKFVWATDGDADDEVSLFQKLTSAELLDLIKP